MKRLRYLATLSASVIAIASTFSSTSAQLIVFDPNNYAQSVLTSARELQQINNQIISLQNQAQMLINQSRNLTSLPYSSLQQIRESSQRTLQLLNQAQRIAHDIKEIDQVFSASYAPASANESEQAMLANAQTRWRNSVASLHDALRIQATVVGNLDTSHAQLSALIGASQGATGALQASQAGNQLVGLQVQQLADLIAMVASQGRAQNLEIAQRAVGQDQGREQLRRFLAPGRGYQPSTVQMFHK